MAGKAEVVITSPEPSLPSSDGAPRRGPTRRGVVAVGAAGLVAVGGGRLAGAAERFINGREALSMPPSPDYFLRLADSAFDQSPSTIVDILTASLDKVKTKEGGGAKLPDFLQLATLPVFLSEWFGSEHGHTHPLLHYGAVAALYTGEAMKGGMTTLQKDGILGLQIYSLAYVFGDKILISDALVNKKEMVAGSNGPEERSVITKPSADALADAKILAQYFLGTLLTNTGVSRAVATLVNAEGQLKREEMRNMGYTDTEIEEAQRRLSAADVAQISSTNPMTQPSFALKGTELLGIDKPWNPVGQVFKPILNLSGKMEVYGQALDAGLAGMTLVNNVVAPLFQGLTHEHAGIPAEIKESMLGALHRVQASPEAAQLFTRMLGTVDYEPLRRVREAIGEKKPGDILSARLGAITEVIGAIFQGDAQDVAAHILPTHMGNLVEALHHEKGMPVQSHMDLITIYNGLFDEASQVFSSLGLPADAMQQIEDMTTNTIKIDPQGGTSRREIVDRLFESVLAYVNGARIDEAGNVVYIESKNDRITTKQLLQLRHAFQTRDIEEQLKGNANLWNKLRPEESEQRALVDSLVAIGAGRPFADKHVEEQFRGDVLTAIKVVLGATREQAVVDSVNPVMRGVLQDALRELGYAVDGTTHVMDVKEAERIRNTFVKGGKGKSKDYTVINKLRSAQIVSQFYNGEFAEQIDPQELRNISRHFVEGHFDTFAVKIALAMGRVASKTMQYSDDVRIFSLAKAVKDHGSTPHYVNHGFQVAYEKVVPQVILAGDVGKLYVQGLDALANERMNPVDLLKWSYLFTHVGAGMINLGVKNPGTLEFVADSYLEIFKTIFPGITDKKDIIGLPLYKLMTLGTELDAEQAASLNSNPTPVDIFRKGVTLPMPGNGDLLRSNRVGLFSAIFNAAYQYFKSNGVAESGGMAVALYNHGIAHSGQELLELTNNGGHVATPEQMLERVIEHTTAGGDHDYLALFRLAVLSSVQDSLDILQRGGSIRSGWVSNAIADILEGYDSDTNAAAQELESQINKLRQQVGITN